MKNLYNSILSDIDDVIDTGDKEMYRISQTPRERFIKIISETGNVVDEKYDLLTQDVIDYIIDNKLIKIKKSRKNKEKN